MNQNQQLNAAYWRKIKSVIPANFVMKLNKYITRMNKPVRSIAVVNREIQSKYPGIELVRGEGYFYLYGTTPETSTMLAGFGSTGIYIHKLNQCTLQQWMDHVDMIMKQRDDNSQHEKDI